MLIKSRKSRAFKALYFSVLYITHQLSSVHLCVSNYKTTKLIIFHSNKLVIVIISKITWILISLGTNKTK